MHIEGYTLLVQLNQVVNIVVETGLVRKEEITVAQLTRGHFLIHLPEVLAAETFIKATPPALWDQVIEFQLWSPHDDATAITIPRFKLLLDLVGFPIHLWREREVIKAVSRFGVYIGTIQPEIPVEFSAWKVAIATDDLRRIPRNIRLSVGGIEYTVAVIPGLLNQAWKKTYSTKGQPPIQTLMTTASQSRGRHYGRSVLAYIPMLEPRH